MFRCHGLSSTTTRRHKSPLGLGASRSRKRASPIPAAFHRNISFARQSSTVVPPSPTESPVNRTRTNIPASAVTEVVGDSGCRYSIQEVLPQKGPCGKHVYLACAEEKKWVIKEIGQDNFKHLLDSYRSVPTSLYLRPLHDAVSERSMFIFRHCNGDFFHLARMALWDDLIRRILKDALRGLAVLHDHDIIHKDLKASNIMMDWKEDYKGVSVTNIQLTGLEDAAQMSSGSDVSGRQMGDLIWRSPEALAEGGVGKPSDMFSFGLICIYAIVERLIFAVDEDRLEEGVDIPAEILRRQISYLADEERLGALLNHLGDSPRCQILNVLRNGFNEETPRTPFTSWLGLDPNFMNLIGRLTNFDPAKRLTARQALEHKWFKNFSFNKY